MRNTAGKTQIQKLIFESDVALSQSDIQHKINDLCDRVTTYRILNRLEDEGLVHKIINTDGVIKYAACRNCSGHSHTHHQHAHFSCEKCKEVTCIETSKINFSIDNNYKVNDVQLLISGICPNCNNH